MSAKRVAFWICLVMLTLTLAGCLGGVGGSEPGDKEQTVDEFLNEVSAAFASLQAKRIADIQEWPIEVELDPAELGIPDYPDDTIVMRMTRNDFVEILEGPLTSARKDGASLTFAIRDPEGGKKRVWFDEPREYAVITNVDLYILLEISQEAAEKVFKELVVNFAVWIAEEVDLSEEQYLEDLHVAVDYLWDLVLDSVMGSSGQWPGVFEYTGPAGNLLLKKQGGKWKISLDYDVLYTAIKRAKAASFR